MKVTLYFRIISSALFIVMPACVRLAGVPADGRGIPALVVPAELRQHLKPLDAAISSRTEKYKAPYSEVMPLKEVTLAGSGPSSWKLEQIYRFEIMGKVRKTGYGNSNISEISPGALMLVWGSISRDEYKNDMSFKADDGLIDCDFSNLLARSGISYETVSSHYANVNLIPADARIKAAAGMIKEGDVVWLSGYLVNIENSARSVSLHTSISVRNYDRREQLLLYTDNLFIYKENYINE